MSWNILLRHSSLLKIVQFESFGAIFYSYSRATMAVYGIVSETKWEVKKSIFFIPPAFSASEKALSDAVLATVTPSSDCAINSVKMNATFSLSLHFLSHSSSPSPWYYRGLCSHHYGFTVDFIPIPAVLPQLSSPLPRFYCSYRRFTAVPIPMQLSTQRHGIYNLCSWILTC